MTVVSETQAPRRTDGFQYFLIGACVVLALLSVALTWQNLRLKRELTARVEAPLANALGPGDDLGQITLREESGETRLLTFAGPQDRSLLLVFSSTCPACRETIPFWGELSAAAGAQAPRMLGLRLDDGLEAPVASFPIVGVDHAGSPAMQHVPYIPAILLVDGSGVVERAWFGVPDADTREQLLQLVHGS